MDRSARSSCRLLLSAPNRRYLLIPTWRRYYADVRNGDLYNIYCSFSRLNCLIRQLRALLMCNQSITLQCTLEADLCSFVSCQYQYWNPYTQKY